MEEIPLVKEVSASVPKIKAPTKTTKKKAVATAEERRPVRTEEAEELPFFREVAEILRE
jgi:hypothetical protein